MKMMLSMPSTSSSAVSVAKAIQASRVAEQFDHGGEVCGVGEGPKIIVSSSLVPSAGGGFRRHGSSAAAGTGDTRHHRPR